MDCKVALRTARRALRDRGLLEAAKWASELAMAVEEGAKEDTRVWREAETGVNGDSEDVYEMGRSYFDLKEFLRCAHALKGQAGPKAVFLRQYSLFLAGEKRRAEEAEEVVSRDGNDDGGANDFAAGGGGAGGRGDVLLPRACA